MCRSDIRVRLRPEQTHQITRRLAPVRRRGQHGRTLLQLLNIGCEGCASKVVAHERERCDLVHLKFVTHYNGELVLVTHKSGTSVKTQTKTSYTMQQALHT